MMIGQSALITGAHGFLGRHAARVFARAGHTVTGIGHGSWARDEAKDFGITFWHSTDVTLDALVTYAGRPTVIVHCAGSGSVPFSMDQPHQDFARTVASTAAVLEYVRLHSPKTIVVYPSSAAVYGTVTRVPISESDSLNPASVYGAHKLMAEALCRSYSRHFDIAIAVVRFFSIYGEGLRKQLLWDACRKLQGGDVTFHGTGDEVRDWLHVDDASALLLAAAEHATREMPIANGGSGVGTRIADMLTRVAVALGDCAMPSFRGIGRSGDPSIYVADTTCARSWGWSPSVDLEEGIRHYVDWYRSVS
jgi:UDP-glucose 4-epimerase